MTKIKTTYATPGNCSNDAEFRRLITEYSTLLAACGLVKASDSGQIDASTVTKPAVGAIAGYEIFRFDDSLQAAHPIFIRVEYGISISNSVGMNINMAVGTATDGAGNVVGAFAKAGGTVTSVTAANVSSYACHTEGFLGVGNRVGSGGSTYVAWGSFVVCRSCDANGYPTGDAVYLLFGMSNAQAQVLKTGGTQVAIPAAPSSQVFQIPLGIRQSVNGEVPMYPIWMPTPALIPIFGLAAYPNNLVTGEDQVRIAMVGSRERTYIAAPNMFTGSTQESGYAMLWED